MDRFLPLKRRACGLLLSTGGLGLIISFSTLVRAEPPMAPMMDKGPVTNAAPASATAPNPAKNQTPPPLPDTYNKYGKILAPSDDAAHPLKLNMQFPGVGEMKIPSQEELNMRDKLEQLAKLSDEDIRKQLNEWPPYTKMKLGDQGQMLVRIQQFKDLRSKVAQDKARELGLLTLTPEQKGKFEKEYWDKRLQMDREVAKQVEPILKARVQKLQEELFREFSVPGSVNPPAPAAKPPSPIAQTNKPVTPAPAAPTTTVPPVGTQPPPATKN